MIDASAPITTLDLDLDALAANVMAEWHIPGLALAVLRRDAPPLLQAFGFTDIESRTRVETATLFPIGSITKSFTATGLGLLVDEGKLGWEVPVREILAEFKLKDPVANEKCTLRDLLTHRIGLPRHDWVHTPGPLDNAGILAALRHLDPSQEFRSAFQIPEPYVSGGRHGGGAHRRAAPGRTSFGPPSSTRSASRTPRPHWRRWCRSTQTTLRRICLKTCFLGCRCGQSIPGPAVAFGRPLPT
jgi:CubicO group peptidase (beta-lactamase class C family)